MGQEPFVEPEKEKEQAETKECTEVTEGKKGIIKLKKDLETEDESVCSHETVEIIGEIKDQEKSEERENENESEAEAADSFVNDVSEAEGRQEPTENQEEHEETNEDSKEDKAADSFINDVSEADGRQEPSEEVEKDEPCDEEK